MNEFGSSDLMRVFKTAHPFPDADRYRLAATVRSFSNIS
jgi:hypothetical protein